MKRLLIAAAAVLALGACATSTPYQAAGQGSRYGYAEDRIDSNRYRVNFAGNSVTSREQVEMYLLYRAAELTVQDGYDWFATAQRATDADTRYVTTGDPWFSSRYGSHWGPSWRYYRRGFWSPWSRWGRWNDPFYNDFDVREVTRFEANAEIVMGRGAKPAGDPQAFDAREVLSNLGPRVARPEGY